MIDVDALSFFSFEISPGFHLSEKDERLDDDDDTAENRPFEVAPLRLAAGTWRAWPSSARRASASRRSACSARRRRAAAAGPSRRSLGSTDGALSLVSDNVNRNHSDEFLLGVVYTACFHAKGH